MNSDLDMNSSLDTSVTSQSLIIQSGLRGILKKPKTFKDLYESLVEFLEDTANKNSKRLSKYITLADLVRFLRNFLLFDP